MKFPLWECVSRHRAAESQLGLTDSQLGGSLHTSVTSTSSLRFTCPRGCCLGGGGAARTWKHQPVNTVLEYDKKKKKMCADVWNCIHIWLVLTGRMEPELVSGYFGGWGDPWTGPGGSRHHLPFLSSAIGCDQARMNE